LGFLELLQHPVGGLIAIGLLGICVGSFLNVVILRLPEMMKREWHEQCTELLESDENQLAADSGDNSLMDQDGFNLNFPASHCPQCQHPLKWWHNIPVISFICLAGRCAFCRKPIPWRYPAVELLTFAASIHLWMHFGATWQLGAALMLVWSLICLTMIDLDHQLLPDNITLPLLWCGLLVNLFDIFTTIESAVVGAIAGYMSFWVIFQVHYRITGKEGLGYGDFKLLAAFGAWLGWELLPMIILFASLTGTLVALIMMIVKKLKRDNPISFGPFLAFGGWMALLWGTVITEKYLQLLAF